MSEAVETRRSEVLQAAARLFTTQGYHGTSMSDLAGALQMTKGALYHHFPSKADLLYEIYEDVAVTISEMFDLHDQTASPEARLSAVIHDILGLIDSRILEVTVYFQEGPFLASCLPRTQVAELKALEARFVNHVVKIIEDGIADKAFAPRDAEATALAVIGSASWASRWYRRDGRLTSQELADVFTDIALGGVRGATGP